MRTPSRSEGRPRAAGGGRRAVADARRACTHRGGDAAAYVDVLMHSVVLVRSRSAHDEHRQGHHFHATASRSSASRQAARVARRPRGTRMGLRRWRAARRPYSCSSHATPGAIAKHVPCHKRNRGCAGRGRAGVEAGVQIAQLVKRRSRRRCGCNTASQCDGCGRNKLRSTCSEGEDGSKMGNRDHRHSVRKIRAPCLL